MKPQLSKSKIEKNIVESFASTMKRMNNVNEAFESNSLKNEFNATALINRNQWRYFVREERVEEKWDSNNGCVIILIGGKQEGVFFPNLGRIDYNKETELSKRINNFNWDRNINDETFSESATPYGTEDEYNFNNDVNNAEVKSSKIIDVTNIREINSLIGDDRARFASIFSSIREEIKSMRIKNETIVATDSHDTCWIFEVLNVDDSKIFLEFTGTAK